MLTSMLQELNGKIGHMVEEAQKKKRHLDHEHTEMQMTEVVEIVLRKW